MSSTPEDDFSSLSLRERLTHSAWKARLQGYNELHAFVEESADVGEWKDIVPKFIMDSNANAQVKGIECAGKWVLALTSKSDCPVEALAKAICSKGITASKPQAKEPLMDLCVAIIEVGEDAEALISPLVAAFKTRNPKAASLAISCVTTCLAAFGAKVISPTLFLKGCVAALANTNKLIRDAAKELVIEAHKWIGGAVMPSLADIKPVLLKELEDEWADQGGRPKPTRKLRSKANASQQANTADQQASGMRNFDPVAADDDVDDGGDADEDSTLDAYDFADEVDGISSLSKTFYAELDEHKWSTRRDALQGALKAVSHVKLAAGGDYGDLIRRLARVISGDSNVINVALAVDCVGAIARGLRMHFHSLAPSVFEVMLDKLKDKKLTVVSSLHAALPHVLAAMPHDKATEVLIASLASKNPDQAKQTAHFLATVLPQHRHAHSPAHAITKANGIALAQALAKCLSARDVSVRDASYTALASLTTRFGEKDVLKKLSGVDEKKRAKIAAIASAQEGTSPDDGSSRKQKPSAKSHPATSVSKALSSSTTATQGSLRSSSSVLRRGTAPKTASADQRKRKGTASTITGRPKGKKGKHSSSEPEKVPDPTYPDMTEGEANDVVRALVSPAMYGQMRESTGWKEKLEGANALLAAMKASAQNELNDQEQQRTAMALCVFVGAATRGWKETNFQIKNAYLSALAAAATDVCKKQVPDRFVHVLSRVAAEKLGDSKTHDAAEALLDAMCVANGPNAVTLLALAQAVSARNPKMHIEALHYACHVVDAFGIKKVNLRAVLRAALSFLSSSNVSVRTMAIDLLGVLRVHAGASIAKAATSDKPALQKMIEDKFDAVMHSVAPRPTLFVRGEDTSVSSDDEGSDDDDGSQDAVGDGEHNDVTDDEEDDDDEGIHPRESLASIIRQQIVDDLDDSGWKVRNAALEELGELLKKHARLDENLGDVYPALVRRLADSNKNLIIISLQMLAAIGKALSRAGCKHNLSAMVEGVLACLGDQKEAIRLAAVDTLTAWSDQCGLHAFFATEAIPQCLRSGKPFAQAGALTWLKAQFEPIADRKGKVAALASGAKAITQPVFMCIVHRNPAVRKAAQGIVPMLGLCLGVEKLRKMALKLPLNAQEAINKGLEGVGPSKSSSASSSRSASSSSLSTTAKSKKTVSAASPRRKASAKPGASSTLSRGAQNRASRKRQTVDATSSSSTDADAAIAGSDVLLILDSHKPQRIKDAKAKKKLKWHFTAPREEHVTQLQSQLKPVCSKALFKQLFSKDFKDHCRASSAITEAVQRGELVDEALASLDLILMWSSLRFFDRNPKVLLRVMALVKALLDAAVDREFSLSEYEAHAFLPFLIQKLGDKMESIRASAHETLQTLVNIYPASHLFSFVIEGLQSKNARIRAGCLVSLQWMLSTQGMAACEQTGAARALRAVGKIVEDRDNTVRSSALDVIVTAYDIQGEGVYKLMGQLPEKSKSLIKERVKRHAKHRTSGEGSSTQQTTAELPPSRATQSTSNEKGRTSLSSTLKPPQVSSIAQEFSLDLDSLNLPAAPRMMMPDLAPTDIQEVASSDGSVSAQQHGNSNPHLAAPGQTVVDGAHRPLAQLPGPRISSASKAGMASSRLSAQNLGSLPSTLHGDASSLQSSTATYTAHPGVFESQLHPSIATVSGALTYGAATTVTLDNVIDCIKSSDTQTAIQALKYAEDLVKEKNLELLADATALVSACTTQLRLVFTEHSVLGASTLSPAMHGTESSRPQSPSRRADTLRLCKHVLSCLMHTYSDHTFAHRVETRVLEPLVVEIIARVLDSQLEKWDEGDNITRALNMILYNILEHSHMNATFEVLIRTLTKVCSGNLIVPAKFTELLMKCLWKLTKSLKTVDVELISVDELIEQIHMFMMEHPPTSWREKGDDTPFRTIKTLLTTIVKRIGPKTMCFLKYLGQDPLSTVVGSYVVLLLHRMGHDEVSLCAMLPPPEERREPRGADDLLQPSLADTDDEGDDGEGRKQREDAADPLENTIVADTSDSAARSPIAAFRSGSVDDEQEYLRSASLDHRDPRHGRSADAGHGRDVDGVSSTTRDPRKVQFVPAHGDDSTSKDATQVLMRDGGGRVRRARKLDSRFDSVAEFESLEKQALSEASSGAFEGLAPKSQEALQAEVGEIIDRITRKETTRQAIEDLRTFKHRHPRFDVMEQCKGLSAYVQSYIVRKLSEDDGHGRPSQSLSGLSSSDSASTESTHAPSSAAFKATPSADIATATNASTANRGTSSSMAKAESSSSVSSYLARLQALRSKAEATVAPSEVQEQSYPEHGVHATEKTPQMQAYDSTSLHEAKEDLPEIVPAADRAPLVQKENTQDASVSDSIANIKARLAKIKRASK